MEDSVPSERTASQCDTHDAAALIAAAARRCFAVGATLRSPIVSPSADQVTLHCIELLNYHRSLSGAALTDVADELVRFGEAVLVAFSAARVGNFWQTIAGMKIEGKESGLLVTCHEPPRHTTPPIARTSTPAPSPLTPETSEALYWQWVVLADLGDDEPRRPLDPVGLFDADFTHCFNDLTLASQILEGRWPGSTAAAEKTETFLQWLKEAALPAVNATLSEAHRWWAQYTQMRADIHPLAENASGQSGSLASEQESSWMPMTREIAALHTRYASHTQWLDDVEVIPASPQVARQATNRNATNSGKAN